jgi:hypothetical protein
MKKETRENMIFTLGSIIGIFLMIQHLINFDTFWLLVGKVCVYGIPNLLAITVLIEIFK